MIFHITVISLTCKWCCVRLSQVQLLRQYPKLASSLCLHQNNNEAALFSQHSRKSVWCRTFFTTPKEVHRTQGQHVAFYQKAKVNVGPVLKYRAGNSPQDFRSPDSVTYLRVLTTVQVSLLSWASSSSWNMGGCSGSLESFNFHSRMAESEPNRDVNSYKSGRKKAPWWE